MRRRRPSPAWCIRKTVAKGNGTVYVMTVGRTFISDGWNLIAECDLPATFAVTRTSVRGLDIKRTLAEVGGACGSAPKLRTRGDSNRPDDLQRQRPWVRPLATPQRSVGGRATVRMIQPPKPDPVRLCDLLIHTMRVFQFSAVMFFLFSSTKASDEDRAYHLSQDIVVSYQVPKELASAYTRVRERFPKATRIELSIRPRLLSESSSQKNPRETSRWR